MFPISRLCHETICLFWLIPPVNLCQETLTVHRQCDPGLQGKHTGLLLNIVIGIEIVFRDLDRKEFGLREPL